MRTALFWIVILIIIPLTLVFMRRNGRQMEKELKESEFLELLYQEQITELTVSDQNTGSIVRISGKYKLNDVVPGAVEDSQPFRTMVVYTDKLDEDLRAHCPERKVSTNNNFWINLLGSILPLGILMLVFFIAYGRMLRNINGGALQFGRSRARLQDPNREKVTLKDVAGCDEAKEDMQEIVDFLKDPVKFNRLGGKIPRGVLMVGPPGTGKTLLARAIAGEANVPFFSISGSDFVEMFVGVGASRVRDMFEEGKKNAPCLLFIDEIDAVGRSRFTGIGGGHDEREQTLNALLVEMDGFETNSGVIVIAATNRPDVLDPALLRPGRFDRQVNVDLPDQRGRLAILNVHAKKFLVDPKVDLRIIARGTAGFSGADLANLLNEAALLATRRGRQMIGLPEMEEARDKVCWGKERRSRRIDDKDRRLTAYHEAGHALMVMLCEHATPLHKITIIPRGNAYLGATMELPEKDRINMTRLELLDHIAVCMGGRVAEEMTFGDITTGAAADIQQATNLAHQMVCAWGMSDKLGFINYGARESHIFLGRDITRNEDFSPETAREIDLEIRRLTEEQLERVRNTLRENEDKLKALAEALLERETLTAADAYALLGIPMPASKRSEADLAFEQQDGQGDSGQGVPSAIPVPDTDGDTPDDAPEGTPAADGTDEPNDSNAL